MDSTRNCREEIGIKSDADLWFESPGNGKDGELGLLMAFIQNVCKISRKIQVSSLEFKELSQG